jgi:hypothetical protein
VSSAHIPLTVVSCARLGVLTRMLRGWRWCWPGLVGSPRVLALMCGRGRGLVLGGDVVGGAVVGQGGDDGVDVAVVEEGYGASTLDGVVDDRGLTRCSVDIQRSLVRRAVCSLMPMRSSSRVALVSHVDGFLVQLKRQGYAANTVVFHLRLMVHLSRWSVSACGSRNWCGAG